MADHYKIAQPVDYYRKFLEQDTRPDGRELDNFRQTTLNIGISTTVDIERSITTANGSALVKLGNTSVICGIKVEITAPKASEPNRGFIVPNVELPALCSSQFKSGPPSELAQTSSLFVYDLILASKCVHLEDLCIAEGRACWVLFCDLVCLDYDGNLLDACVLALVTALRNVLLPVATLNGESNQIEVDMNSKIPLRTNCCPVSTTFAVFEQKILCADPTREEEDLASGLITVVTLDSGELCMVHKPGGSAVSETKLQECIVVAHRRTTHVFSLIESAIGSIDR